MLLGGAGLAAAAQLPRAAVAEYYGAPPPKASGAAYREALQEAKDYKYAPRPVAGTESEEARLQAAERVRGEG